MKIKVILQADVAGLGEEGEVKEVAGGYARNYLLPRKLVAPATKGNLKVLEQQREKIAARQEQHRAEAQSLADRLAGVTLDFPVRVGEQGRLYGSITAQDIAERLRGQGIEVDRRVIELREPLRALGSYDVSVRVAHAVTGHVKVTLRDQNAPVAQAAAEAPSSTEAEPEFLGEDAVPVGAGPVDTVVPASDVAPAPLQSADGPSGGETEEERA